MNKESIEAISSFIEIPKSKLEKIVLFNQDISINKEKYENLIVSYNKYTIASYYHVDSIKMTMGPDEKIYLNIYDKESNKIGCINSITDKRFNIKVSNKNVYINIYDK